MIDQPRDRPPHDTSDTERSEHVVHTSHVRETGSPATGFIVGGLVVAVAIIAFFIFGDTETRQTAEINMPPEVEDNVNTPTPQPNTTPGNDAAAPADSGNAAGSDTSATPSSPDSGSTN